MALLMIIERTNKNLADYYYCYFLFYFFLYYLFFGQAERLRNSTLAELFSQVADLSPVAVNYYYAENFKLWHTYKLTNSKSLPSDFFGYIINVREQDLSNVSEWKWMYNSFLY